MYLSLPMLLVATVYNVAAFQSTKLSFMTDIRRSSLEAPSSPRVCQSLLHGSALTRSTTILYVQRQPSPQQKLSPLPVGISPFEKGLSKSLDIQGELRNRAQSAVQRAIADGYRCLEIEFPPLLGGQRSASQFDDFDNIQELNQNRDWCVQFAPQLVASIKQQQPTWLIFGDDKECQLAQQEWSGQRYQQAAKFTSIEAVTKLYTSTSSSSQKKSNDEPSSYSAPWGAVFASTMSKLLSNSKDDDTSTSLLSSDDISTSSSSATGDGAGIHLVCQPGNGGPVEDWINTEVLHTLAWNPNAITIVVNGALDKVRDGYYPSFAFPRLAKTMPFYQGFTQALYLKPIYEQGQYGWLFRQYPEPWQVVLQTKTDSPNKRSGRLVEERVALVSEQRPSYREAVQALVRAAQETE